MKVTNFFTLFISIVIGIAVSSCGSSGQQDDSDVEEPVEEVKNDGSTLMEVSGQLFSIPSPIQTAILIQDVGSTYNAEIMNEASKVTSYVSNFDQALNLGIYGADLGYVTIYNQTQDAISYLGSVKKLADGLGIASTFDLALAERFERNIGNKDSLLEMVSDAFRSTDAYLKTNDRNEVGVLVLTGGWIESLYFSVKVANQTANDEVIRRIGEQKSTCNNLVKLLMPKYNNSEYTSLIDQLSELNDVFKKIETSYTYNEPTVDVANKTTTFNSVSEIIVNDEQLKQITAITESIRSEIIN